MPTRLDDAKIKITLDTADAERKLDELERRRAAQAAQAVEAARQRAERTGGRPRGPGVQRKEGEPIPDDSNYTFVRKSSLERLRDRGGADPTESGGREAAGAALLAARMARSGAVKVAGGLVAAYGAFRSTTMFLSESVEAVRRVLPEWLKENDFLKNYIDQTIETRKALVEIESKVRAAIESFSSSKDFVSEAYRLTGLVPNVGFIFEMDYETKKKELQLEDTFDRIKGTERKSGVLEFLTETMKRSMF